MMRLLFIGNFLSGSRGTINPTEKLISRFAEEGYSVSSSSSKENTALRFFDIIFAALLRSYRVIHIDVFSGKALWFALVAARIGRLRRKVVILNLHGGRLGELYDQKKQQIEYLFALGNHIITPSIFLQEFFTALGHNVRYLPNAIDLQQFTRSWQLSTLRQRKLLWVRAFSEIYRPKLAVDVLRQVLVDFPEATLTMIGPDGGLKSDTVTYVRSLGLQNRIEILGSVENRALPLYFQNHSIFLNTTSYESFGMAVMEAVACGVPVVSTAVGEIPYLWKNGVEVMLVTDAQAISFAAQIKKVFEDDKLAERLSSNAERKSKNFSWDLVKQQWVNILPKS